MSAIPTAGYQGVTGRSETFNVPLSIPTYVNAGDNNDAILAFDSDDYLIGGLGGDLIFGYGGNDTIIGDQYWNDETSSVFTTSAAAGDLILGDSFAGSA